MHQEVFQLIDNSGFKGTRVTRFVESPKYELEANTLEIKRVQREDAGLYYCVLQQRHSVSSF